MKLIWSWNWTSRARMSGRPPGSFKAASIRFRSPTATSLSGDVMAGPWSIITSPPEPEKALRGVIRRPFAAMPSAPFANSRLTRSLDIFEVDPVAGFCVGVGSWHAVGEVDLDPRSVKSGQPCMSSKFGDLVLKGLGGGGPLGGGSLQRVDLGAERGDLGARVSVARRQLLDAAHQRLVAGHLVGGGKELDLDLPGDQEAGRQGNGGDHEYAHHTPAVHDGNSRLDGGGDQRRGVGRSPPRLFLHPSTIGFPNGGRNPRFCFQDRPAAL